jgi:hypothetical protein
MPQAQTTPARPEAGHVLLQPTPRIRPLCPIRLGGVYTLGLGNGSADGEDSAALGIKLSADSQRWIAANFDVIALDTNTITPETFPALTKAQPRLTPLLLLSGFALFESPTHHGSVGGWKPEMSNWTLRSTDNKEVPYPMQGGHWMDFTNPDWATHWRNQAQTLVHEYGAQGVVASDLPLTNLYVGDDLADYKTTEDREQATAAWLRAVHAPKQFLLIPSARGFGFVAVHPTLPTPTGTEEENLSGRIWDDYYSLMDGGWAEGWVHWYTDDGPIPEDDWEIALEAADRAGRGGQVFIAAAAYHNDSELEFALASYLLIVHTQGRCVFQPMPLLPGERLDAGRSLAVLRKQVSAKSAYFNVPLGLPMQERHPVPAQGGSVWRRGFQGGTVYVNSSERRTCTLQFGGAMQHITGEMVNSVQLPPQSGVILLYLPTK